MASQEFGPNRKSRKLEERRARRTEIDPATGEKIKGERRRASEKEHDLWNARRDMEKGFYEERRRGKEGSLPGHDVEESFDGF